MSVAAGFVLMSFLAHCASDSFSDGNANDGGAEASDAPGDAPGTDANTVVDAGGATCDMAAPFTNIHTVDELNTPQNDQHARLSPDELQIWFASSGLDGGTDGSFDIFYGTRPTPAGPFLNIQGATGLNTLFAETAPTLSGDLLELVYASNAASLSLGGTRDLYRSTRPDRDAGFGAGTHLSISAVASNDEDPYLTADDQTLYFASDRAGPSVIYRAQHSAGNLFQPATVVAELTSGFIDSHPVVSADGLWIYWSSQRTDIGGHKGQNDIYVAHRPTAVATFGFVAIVSEVNTADHDEPSWISPDGCRLYFARRAGDAGKTDIWLAERLR